MTQLIKINIEEEIDKQSGDIYYTIEAQIMEPGGMFDEGNPKEQLKDRFKKVFLP